MMNRLAANRGEFIEEKIWYKSALVRYGLVSDRRTSLYFRENDKESIIPTTFEKDFYHFIWKFILNISFIFPLNSSKIQQIIISYVNRYVNYIAALINF